MHIAGGVVVTMTVLTFRTVLTLDDTRTPGTALYPGCHNVRRQGAGICPSLEYCQGVRGHLAPAAFLLNNNARANARTLTMTGQ